ncbi:Uma2 family endonuclease [Kitasatospora nipponensis]|uniref:Uma2 family endonuclease n=1 Tax=Kitasatospora nipponensis TaxID=258049 RepID=A0ABP4HAP7_9ACTN
MTVIDERAHRFLDSIEIPEGYRVELLNGEIILTPSGKPLHWRIQSALLKQFWQYDSWETVAEQTIRHPRFGDEPQPDLCALSASAPADQEGTYQAEHVELVVEVLSKSTRATDLLTKVEVYSRFGIPLYLIIDPFKRQCTLHRFPKAESYGDAVTLDFGRGVHLPEPFGFTLDTTSFPSYRSTGDS